MKLYIIRHGQTDWNIQGKIQGQTDTVLNETGIKQAQIAKENLANTEFDLVICSPLKRAKQTAEIILKERNIPVIFDDRLKETYFGKLEGIIENETTKPIFRKR